MTVEQVKEANNIVDTIEGLNNIINGLPIPSGRQPLDHISIYPVVRQRDGRQYSGDEVDIPASVLSMSKLKDILVDYKNSLTDKLSKM